MELAGGLDQDEGERHRDHGQGHETGGGPELQGLDEQPAHARGQKQREAEVADLKRQFDEASAKATSAFNNPLDIAQKEVEAAFGTEPAASDKPAETASVSTADPGAIEPSAGAPVAEAPPSVVPDVPMVAADGTIEIKPDPAKPGGGGAA